MRRTSVYRPHHLVCPACGYGALRPRGPLSRSADCESCRCTYGDVTVGTLKQIVALPDAMGKHACECGHPEMRSLPDGTFHCPPADRRWCLPDPISESSWTLRKKANKDDLLGIAGKEDRVGADHPRRASYPKALPQGVTPGRVCKVVTFYGY